MKRILINTPQINKPGGVANHYLGLKSYWNQNVKYNYTGKRYKIPLIFILPFDILRFIFLCKFGDFDVILLNPSLTKNAIKRDSLFLKISNFFKIKTIVFFHGWDEDIAKKLAKNPSRFLTKFDKADGFIVLASIFKKKILEWGINAPVYLSSTKINDSLLLNFDLANKKKTNTILFLARVEINKGILIAIDAFTIIQKYIPNVKLKIAGTGSAEVHVKEYINKKQINNIEFLGNLSGEEVANAFKNSDIYLLPTTHGEGMPTSVLEAMGFGLPVITRPVGGLKDFFEETKMGFLIDGLTPSLYADKIKYLLSNDCIRNTISEFNHNYAIKNFLASKVARQIEQILLNNKDD